MPGKSKVKVHPFEHLAKGAHSCKQCSTHVASEAEKFSTEALRGANSGLADLFTTAINVIYGLPRHRNMGVGSHFGMDIHCADCRSVIGWKSTVTYNIMEKDKEGRYLLDRNNVADPGPNA